MPGALAADSRAACPFNCQAQENLFLPYFPLASGRLTGHDELVGPARRLAVTPAQVALAWLLRRSPAVVVIPGTSNPQHLHANIAAAKVAENLTDDELARLTRLVDESKATVDQPHQSTIDVHRAARYPPTSEHPPVGWVPRSPVRLRSTRSIPTSRFATNVWHRLITRRLGSIRICRDPRVSCLRMG